MDSILYWNEVSLDANRESHTNGTGEQTGSTASARALAIVHLAMYDAYAGIANDPTNLPPYLSGLTAPFGASIDAAVAAAAHAILSALFPSQKAFFDLKLAEVGLSEAGLNEGLDFGRIVALAILADHAGDPGVGSQGYVGSMARGYHKGTQIMRHRFPALLSIKHTSDEKTLTIEDNQTDSRKSFFAQTIASLAKIGEVIFRFMQINQDTEPQITRLHGKEGETFWKIYQPNTGKTFYCMTDYEVMEWLDRRF